MTIPILFEDEYFIAINKPPGIVVNRAESVKTETIQDWAERKFQMINDQCQIQNKDHWSLDIGHLEFCSRSGIVHRIDKETSGILLIAKSPEIFGQLKQQFMERTIKKVYLCLTHGALPSEEGTIEAPIGRLPWNREQFGVTPEGKPSLTRYKVLEVYDYKNKKQKEKISLVEMYPETGRTHQIRVHLKYINRPILGDYLYAGRKTARDDRIWVPRVMLHATKLTLNHPKTGEVQIIEAPMPEDMKEVIEVLNSKIQNPNSKQ